VTTVQALQQCLGDTARFGSLRDRVELLFEEQTRTWVSGTTGWIVVPVQRRPAGFYLLSADREGQRRGREVLQAFLGPATAVLESVPLTPDVEDTDRLLQAARLVHLSYVRRTAATPEDLLNRLEDAIATVKGKDARLRPLRPSHLDLLRDFRLALLQRDGRQAEQSLEDLRLTGQLSAENLRFLTIDMLGRLERWRELRDLPHLTELLRARRPRLVNEVLLEMIWWTEVAEPSATGSAAQDIYAMSDLGARYGAVISAIDVPTTAAGRAVGAIAARALGDMQRLQRLLLAVSDEAERERLQRLASPAEEQPAKRTTAQNDLDGLFDEGQYGAVVRAFLDAPDPAAADLAVRASIEAEDDIHAAAVLAAVQAFIADEQLRLDRRLLRDLEDLTRLADGSCRGWREWCSRLGGQRRWPEAAQVLRTQHEHWDDLLSLTQAGMCEAADGLLSGWTGVNQDQVVMCLDVLCVAAADGALKSQAGEFCDAVLLILAEQQNLSAPVREAYLLLLEQLIEGGPTEPRYRETLEQGIELWKRIASPVTVDWGLSLVDILLDTPAPAPDLRVAVIAEVLNKARNFQQRISMRQRSELEALAEEIGLPVQNLQAPAGDIDVSWNRLNGTVVGLYSLLPHAAESLGKRLSRLCSPAAVEGNADTVATAALRSLATRADYLIVDTRHAAHAATDAIDSVRPRNKQIMPQGRGVTAFLQALEHSLAPAH
jgi:hypothetical protein